MSIFKNLESCPNCIHRDVCMYKDNYAQLVADLEKDDRLLPTGVDFIQPLVVRCKYFKTEKIERKPMTYEYD